MNKLTNTLITNLREHVNNLVNQNSDFQKIIYNQNEYIKELETKLGNGTAEPIPHSSKIKTKGKRALLNNNQIKKPL